MSMYQQYSAASLFFFKVMHIQDKIANITAYVDDLNVTVSLGDICFAPLMPEGSHVTPHNCSVMVSGAQPQCFTFVIVKLMERIVF